MKCISTYCSASKDPDKGLIPAFRRYISPRINFVKEIAEKEDIHFCILSGEFGLVDWNQQLPWYDHLLLREEVPDLVEKVIDQINNKKFSEIDFYTRSPKQDLNIIPYLNTIEKASQLTNIKLNLFTLEEPKLSAKIRNWKLIMEKAAEARQKMIVDRKNGENEFKNLLKFFPDDGMIFFQRGSGFEAMGEYSLAKSDYEMAKGLFPLDRWQWQAQEAINRINQDLSKSGTISEANRRLRNLKNIDPVLITKITATIRQARNNPISAAIELRRYLEIIIREILDKSGKISNGLSNNIYTLLNSGEIPEIVASHMHTVRIIGNRAAHPETGSVILNPADVYPSVTAFLSILEWLDNSN